MPLVHFQNSCKYHSLRYQTSRCWFDVQFEGQPDLTGQVLSCVNLDDHFIVKLYTHIYDDEDQQDQNLDKDKYYALLQNVHNLKFEIIDRAGNILETKEYPVKFIDISDDAYSYEIPQDPDVYVYALFKKI